MSEQTETQTVAEASEFLTAVQRLVKASVAEATKGQSPIGRGTKMCERCGKLKCECQPEVSQAEKEKERAAFETGCDSAKRDANEWYGKYLANQTSNVNLRSEVARLTKELAEERAPKTASGKTAQAIRAYLDQCRSEESWPQYGIVAQLFKDNFAPLTGISTLTAEREARVAAEKELAAIDQALFDMSLHYAPNRVLAIERAKVQREVTAERDALRAQLQQAEDRITKLRKRVSGAEQELLRVSDVARERQEKLQQAEQMRDDALRHSNQLGEELKNEVTARLQAELAATQETVRRVERERDGVMELFNERLHEMAGAQTFVDLFLKTRDERDALKKQNVALTSELAAVRVCFAEASQSAGPTTVHVQKLKARNAEMAEALERIVNWNEFPTVADRLGAKISYQTAYGSIGERDYMREVAKKALNQSSE